ncbi:MAG TPA: tail fiber domain-containing protein [Candidatus Eisenbacteria bacterium]|nr:tail fiber domain-containing protein [Candidatus Eisenbacteria bacterium]
MKSLPLVFAAGILLWAVSASAEDATVTTYYSTPNTSYKNLYVSDDLTVGTAGSGAVTLNGTNTGGAPDVLHLRNNQLGAWQGGSSGGDLVINGNLNVRNTGGSSLFFVNAATNRVGVGTTTPRVPLEVLGDIKGMIVAAHYDTVDYAQPWADMFAQYNTVDNKDSNVTNGPGSRLSATYQDFTGYHFCTQHLDGNPLVFQTIAKPGITTGQGKGQVVIRGIQIDGDNDLIFIVGEAVAAYGTDLPVARANAFSPLASSRLYKKDIEVLTPSDYSAVLDSLARADVVRYLYKGESDANRPHTGFLAEDAPAQVVTSGRKAVSLGDEMGFLLAATKALRLETDDLKRRTERLKPCETKR